MKQLLRELHELKDRTLHNAENTTWVIRDAYLGIHHALQYMLDDYDAMTAQLSDEVRELYAAHLTGSRTLLHYLIKPILRAKANALTER